MSSKSPDSDWSPNTSKFKFGADMQPNKNSTTTDGEDDSQNHFGLLNLQDELTNIRANRNENTRLILQDELTNARANRNENTRLSIESPRESQDGMTITRVDESDHNGPTIESPRKDLDTVERGNKNHLLETIEDAVRIPPASEIGSDHGPHQLREVRGDDIEIRRGDLPTHLIIEERDTLRVELTAFRQINKELAAQISAYSHLLKKAEAILQGDTTLKTTIIGFTKFENSQSAAPITTAWIRGTWLTESNQEPFLGQAELFFERTLFKAAMISLRRLLERTDIPITVRIDAELLMSAILRTTDDLPPGLAHAEDALRMAYGAQDIRLMGKAHFHRGICLYKMEAFAEASMSFTLALNTAHHEEEALAWKDMAEIRKAEVASR